MHVGHGFVFQQPDGCLSFELPSVTDIASQPGVLASRFDMCFFGMVSPVRQIPMKKRTKLLTNVRSVYEMTNGRFCKGDHQHVVIQNLGGERRSRHAQIYPDELCKCFVGAVKAHVFL